MELLNELKTRNRPLYFFGVINLLFAVVSILMIGTTDTTVLGINAWIKPLKFFLSTVIFAWTMGWYLPYLNLKRTAVIYTWVVIFMLSFENVYITWQAHNGELSHFNKSSVFHIIMFALMGVAITLMTLHTLYIGVLFFAKRFPSLSPSYVWGIRLGILFFVIFAFEGGIMALRYAHTVDAPDGGDGLLLLNWSTSYGDLRVAHFFGMHSLQVLPIAGYYLFKTRFSILLFSASYFVIVSSFMYQALKGLPIITM